jgi:glycosyltransferase involved in cell wall biosynthesis
VASSTNGAIETRSSAVTDDQLPTRMRLLQLTGTLEPAYGGPPAVLNGLTRQLTDIGHSVDTLTLDPPTAPWLSDSPIVPIALGPGTGTYGYSRRLRPWLQKHAPEYDAVIVHGIWQYQSLAARLACREAAVPYFLFVHGALDPWFQQRYPGKHAKKALYWRMSEHRSLRDAKAVLFTCEEERRLASESFTPYRAEEAIVGIGVDEPPGDATTQKDAFFSRYPDLREKRIMLFLGRLHPKKGCDLLIQAFAEVCARDARLHLVMAGPDESGTEAELRKLSQSLGMADRITWTGMLLGDAKWGAFRAADVFVLTSHSENFGITIPEALACGLPVLISDKVNIWREIAEAGAGFVEPDTVGGAEVLLQRWIELPEAESDAMRVRARSCFVDKFEARRAAVDFAAAIAQSIGKTGAA